MMQLTTALFHPEKYHELTKKKWWQTLLYLLFWVFLVTTVVNVVNLSVNRIEKEEISQNIPEFQIQDGVLQVEGGVYEFTDEEGSIYIMADTSISDFSAEEIKGAATQEIYISKDKIIVYLLGEKYNTMSISLLGMDGMTKEVFVEYIYVSIWIVSLLMIVFEAISLFLQTILYILMTIFIVDILAKFMGKRIAFGKLFQCGMYASTLGVLCQLFQIWHLLRGVDYEPTVFYYLSYILTIVYMVRVVIKWKNES